MEKQLVKTDQVSYCDFGDYALVLRHTKSTTKPVKRGLTQRNVIFYCGCPRKYVGRLCQEGGSSVARAISRYGSIIKGGGKHSGENSKNIVL